MAGKPSAAQEAAEKMYHKAPEDGKPTARQLADRYKLSESAIHKSDWWKNRAQPQTGEK
jgi:hypothetical protein